MHESDQMWHQHILDVVNYYHDMMLLCGRVIGHNPDGAMAGKAERDEATKNALEQRFPDYERDIWGHVMSIKLRFRDQYGNEEIIEAVYKGSMEGAFRKYAQKRNTALHLVKFRLNNGSLIQMASTPKDLGLRENAIIRTSVSSVDTITIRVKDLTGEETMFTVKRTTRMGKIFDAYAARKGCCPQSLRFSLDGENILCDFTPAELQLEDHDQIDVILAQMGC